MGDLQDTFSLAKDFKELFGIVSETTYKHCKRWVDQRKVNTQKSLSNWLKRAIVYDAERFTEKFLNEAKIKNPEVRDALINPIVGGYRSLD